MVAKKTGQGRHKKAVQGRVLSCRIEEDLAQRLERWASSQGLDLTQFVKGQLRLLASRQTPLTAAAS